MAPKFSILPCLFRIVLIIHEKTAPVRILVLFLSQIRKISVTRHSKPYSVTSKYCIASLVIWKLFQVRISCPGKEGADLGVKTHTTQEMTGSSAVSFYGNLQFRNLIPFPSISVNSLGHHPLYISK